MARLQYIFSFAQKVKSSELCSVPRGCVKGALYREMYGSMFSFIQKVSPCFFRKRWRWEAGNALAQVHEPIVLWDITFCTCEFWGLFIASRGFWGPEFYSIESRPKFLTHALEGHGPNKLKYIPTALLYSCNASRGVSYGLFSVFIMHLFYRYILYFIKNSLFARWLPNLLQVAGKNCNLWKISNRKTLSILILTIHSLILSQRYLNRTLIE